MTAIIIEDEALAARELESILKKLAPEIEIVASQDSVHLKLWKFWLVSLKNQWKKLRNPVGIPEL